MSLTKHFGYTDSASTVTKHFRVPNTDLKTDFTVQSASDGEVIYDNITTTGDFYEKVRIAESEIKNVYKNTGINPANYGRNTKGSSLLVSDKVLYRVEGVSDGTDGGAAGVNYMLDLPLECHIVVKTPISEFVTDEIIQEVILRAASYLSKKDKDMDAMAYQPSSGSRQVAKRPRVWAKGGVQDKEA